MLDRIYRFNPAYRLTPYSDLPERYQKKFAPLVKDGRYHSFLHAPRETGLTIKAVTRDLADLLGRLREPGSLNALFRELGERIDEEKRKFFFRLVIDGVLEVKKGDSFISGVEGVNSILPSGRSSPAEYSGEAEGEIQKLSAEGISFAVNSALTRPQDLSILLYNFNCIPMYRTWRERFPGEDDILRFLGLREDHTWPGMPPDISPRRPKEGSSTDKLAYYENWISWKFTRGRERDKLNYKVYLSPVPADLPRVFELAREEIVRRDVCFMKVGRRRNNLLRPDKLVVYFQDYREASDFAGGMVDRTAGYTAQGVPFSYQIDRDNPLVSMGVDPPRRMSENISWRLYVTNKLAMAVHGARREEAGDIDGYIRDYMRIAGVDSGSWGPLDGNWEMEFSQVEELEKDERKER